MFASPHVGTCNSTYMSAYVSDTALSLAANLRQSGLVRSEGPEGPKDHLFKRVARYVDPADQHHRLATHLSYMRHMPTDTRSGLSQHGTGDTGVLPAVCMLQAIAKILLKAPHPVC